MVDDKKKAELEKDFDEAYRLAMEMVIEKRGGDRSCLLYTSTATLPHRKSPLSVSLLQIQYIIFRGLRTPLPMWRNGSPLLKE